MALEHIEAVRHANWVRINYDGGMVASGHLYLKDRQAEQLVEEIQSALED